MKSPLLVVAVVSLAACGLSDERSRPPPFKTTITLIDSIRTAGCEYFLIFQANDSSTTVRYSWDVVIGRSDLDGITSVPGETRNVTVVS